MSNQEKQVLTLPCPKCQKLRDLSHLPEQVTDWEELLPVLAQEICQACRMEEITKSLQNGNIHLCFREDVGGR